MKTSWFWKESPVMWVPWIQFIMMYLILGPTIIIGVLLMIAGSCNALAGDYSLFLWGIGLTIVSFLIGFTLEGIVLNRKEKS